MSLLLNQEFSIYQLRQAYLNNICDGVGERLITLNTEALNNPAFRAAGWTPDTAAVKRCYSPPIPTTGAGVASEYFQAPRTRHRLDNDCGSRGGGLVTGQAGSDDTAGMGARAGLQRRRRRKEPVEEEDSSDLSDESEDDERTTAAQGIHFPKMPLRRTGEEEHGKDSRTLRSRDDDSATGPELNVISPSRPPDPVSMGLTRGSLGQVESVKQRARRDTTTSSEMSSENEVEAGGFHLRPRGRSGGKKSVVVISEKIQEEESRELEAERDEDCAYSDLEDDVGEASDLSDEFEVEVGSIQGSQSTHLLGIGARHASEDTSPVKPVDMPPPITPGLDRSPRKQSTGRFDTSLPKLPRLPPGRPMSMAVPPSLLTMALQGGGGDGGSSDEPFRRFAELSGKGDPSPLWIKIYAPFSSDPTRPIEAPLRKTKDGNPVTVAELIGLALWRYNEEGITPPLAQDELSINHWTLRIVEDEEVDFDFPALVRTRPVTDFTSNNNRPPQRRARDKPWDEFGLVKATEDQVKENHELTPEPASIAPGPVPAPTPAPMPTSRRPTLGDMQQLSTSSIQTSRTPTAASFQPPRNPITGPSFASSALRKDPPALLDAPQPAEPQSTPRTGVPRTVTIHFTDPSTIASTQFPLSTTSDTYIAELFDPACKKLNLDKALYVFKVRGTPTVAPSDRTVEALGDNLALDLVRRRFGGPGDGTFGLGLSGSSFGGSSPNAPLDLAATAPSSAYTAAAGKRRKPFASTPRVPATTNPLLQLATAHRYAVHRKQPLSFAPSAPRTLIVTPHYLQIMPDGLAPPSGKVTSVPMSTIIGVKVGSKHPKMVRVLVWRERETKRYDFECASPEEAAEICGEVRKAVQGWVGDAA